MKNGNVNDFIEKTTYEECAVLYRGVKYFFHGLIYDKDSETYSYDIDVWDHNDNYVKSVFNKNAKTAKECIESAQKEPIFDGKDFWNAEIDMEWIEW